jgi:hypothetical protein
LLNHQLAGITDAMSEVIQKNTALFVGMIAAAFVCVPAASWVMFHTGAPGPGVLQAQSPIAATLVTIICVGIAAVIAGIAGRFSNAAIGMFVLGAGVFILARRMGTAENLIFGEGSLALLGVETILWAAIIFGCTLIVFRIAGPLRDIEPEVTGRHPDPFFSREAMICAGAGVLMVAMVWLAAQSPMKGQMLGATFLGGVAAGLAGRLISPHVQPMLLFATPCLFGGIGHLIGSVMLHQPPDLALISGELSSLNRPMPIDYAAGSLLGVAFGLGWAKSFLHHEET